jgi:hypothetical protein
MNLAELRSVLLGSGIDDVLVAGFVDTSERPLRFYALYRAVFLELGGELLKFSVLGDTGRMQISRTNDLSFGDLDEDLERASTSLRQVVLDDPDGSNRLQRLHLWSLGNGPDGIECSAARIDLANGQKIFLDPTYHFGIRLGGASQQTVWMENSPQQDHSHLEMDLTTASEPDSSEV